MTDCIKALLSKKNESALLFLGQAGFIIKSKTGQLLAIDLYLSDCVENFEGHIGFKRLIPAVVDAETLHLDVIIATHHHLDHFDKITIPILMRNGTPKLFAAADCKRFDTGLGGSAEKVQYVRPDDQFKIGDFNIHFVNCDHGNAAPDAVGVIVEVDGKRILETGDTCLRLDLVPEYLSEGELDVLIAPINGKYGNMNAKELTILSSKIRPKLTVPCHFGMFASHGGEPAEFMEYMNSEKLNFTFMTVGEVYTL